MAADEIGGARPGPAEFPVAHELAGDGLPPVVHLDLHRRPWPASAEPEAIERGGLRPIRVLVLATDEDVTIIRSLLTRAEQAHFVVDRATNAETALAALCRGQHDVCLCDQRQPTGEGLHLAREAARRGIEAPIVLVSALGLPDLDLEAIAAGAADFSTRSSSTSKDWSAPFASPSPGRGGNRRSRPGMPAASCSWTE